MYCYSHVTLWLGGSAASHYACHTEIFAGIVPFFRLCSLVSVLGHRPHVLLYKRVPVESLV